MLKGVLTSRQIPNALGCHTHTHDQVLPWEPPHPAHQYSPTQPRRHTEVFGWNSDPGLYPGRRFLVFGGARANVPGEQPTRQLSCPLRTRRTRQTAAGAVLPATLRGLSGGRSLPSQHHFRPHRACKWQCCRPSWHGQEAPLAFA